MSGLQQFIDFCNKVHPQHQEDIQRFFEGVVFFPYDNELLLEAFLYLNIQNYFPLCTNLLLFEKSPNGENTDRGKCDFVYLTRHGTILLIETKFIDTESKGATERKKRNEHRGKVFKQVSDLRQKFSDEWRIPIELIGCSVFTTQDLTHRDEARGISAMHVSIVTLNQWQQELRNRLRASD